MAGTTTVHVNPALLWSSILQWMLCADSLSQPARDGWMDGVTGDGTLTPAYLAMPGCPSLLVRSASVCSSFSALLIGPVVCTEGCGRWDVGI